MTTAGQLAWPRRCETSHRDRFFRKGALPTRPGLFNRATGFRILDTALGEPALIVAKLLHSIASNMDREPAFLGSTVLCEKIGDAHLEWDVTTAEVLEDEYPL